VKRGNSPAQSSYSKATAAIQAWQRPFLQWRYLGRNLWLSLMPKRFLVTGGAGIIGFAFMRHMCGSKEKSMPRWRMPINK
jgi:hypothetical protein